ARAAAAALSTSAASASATCAMVSPVAGLMVGKVLPEAASVHLLLMSSLVALTLTVGSMAAEAVAMRIPPKDAAKLPMGTSRRQKNLRSRDPGRTGQPHSVEGSSSEPASRAPRVAPTTRAYSGARGEAR